MVRLRQIVYDIGSSLLVVPLACVVAAIVLSQLMLQIDGELSAEGIPRALETTVEGGRAMLTAIAGGLISSVTLLLSLLLVAVQLASSQFSPRTLQGWTSDRAQQLTIGLVLGTSVYCLLVLRETRSLGEGAVLVPHVSVLLAVVLGVLSLIAVVRSVDQLTRSLRVGSVAESITEQTLALIHRRGGDLALERPQLRPADRQPPVHGEALDTLVVTSDRRGWVQQIDEGGLLRAIPEGSTLRLATMVGGHVAPAAPLAWVWPAPADDACDVAVRSAIALGPERTMQQDIGYGILQLVDVALRALSPGVNDPNTANDVVVSLGVVLLAIWEYPEEPELRSGDDGRTLVRQRLTHGDFLESTFGPLRRHGAAEVSVVETMLRTLGVLRSETERRDLAGPVEPIEDMMREIVAAFERTSPPRIDAARVEALLVDR